MSSRRQSLVWWLAFATIAIQSTSSFSPPGEVYPKFVGHQSALLAKAKSSSKHHDKVVLEEEEQHPHYESARYKNRATLLQETLKRKVQELGNVSQELQIKDSKLQVLQDVVKRLSKREIQQNETSTSEITKLQKQLQEIRDENQSLQIKDKEQIKQLTLELQDHKVMLKKLNKKHTDKLADMAKKRSALKDEMLVLDEKVERTEDELKQMRKTLATQEMESSKALEKEKEKVDTLQTKLDTIQKERDDLMAKLENASKLDKEQMESVEIAKGAVSAAEKREKDAIAKLNQVEQELESAMQEKELLSSEVDELRDLTKVLNARLKEFADSQQRNDSLQTKIGNLEKELERSQRETQIANDLLAKERVKAASLRKNDLAKFEVLLNDETEGYQVEIEKLRNELVLQQFYASIISRLPSPENETATRERKGIIRKILRLSRHWFGKLVRRKR